VIERQRHTNSGVDAVDDTPGADEEAAADDTADEAPPCALKRREAAVDIGTAAVAGADVPDVLPDEEDTGEGDGISSVCNVDALDMGGVGVGLGLIWRGEGREGPPDDAEEAGASDIGGTEGCLPAP
jgi:hypothetical protein